ncbi:hypothetical protein AB4305_20325 [Nocardia sp. 2YAB30]|uniref:hypothetical protein n=1 Tax=unclassified Nocardia TaxID=2637762 RepID=UPI003F9B1BBB
MSVLLEREREYYGITRAVHADDEGMQAFQTVSAAAELAADMNVDSTVQWARCDGTVLVHLQPD